MKAYYDEGGVQIFHGDCREVLPQLEPVECVVCSPPYNQLAELADVKPSGIWAQRGGALGFVERWQNCGYLDDMGESDYQRFLCSLFSGINAKSLFFNHQLRWRDGTLLHPVQWFKPDGWRLRTEIVWDRRGGLMFNARMFCRFDERILWFVRGDDWTWNQDAVGFGTVWRIPRIERKEHPVSFPIQIPQRCIIAASSGGDTILDPFMGSGTTLRAAKDLGRKAIGIEIEEKYCAIAAERLRQSAFEFNSNSDIIRHASMDASQQTFLVEGRKK